MAMQDAPVESTDGGVDVVCAADKRAKFTTLFNGSSGYYSKAGSNRKRRISIAEKFTYN
jgi:hypothetical protein